MNEADEKKERAFYEEALKKSKIFMPETAERQQRAINSGQLFAHYTSARVIIEIIRKREIWLRNVRLMNDYSEVVHGVSQIEQLLNDPASIDSLKRSIEMISTHAWDKSIQQFHTWKGHLQSNTFIFCLSEHENNDKLGRLSMWRAYGGKSAKASLLIDFPFGRVFAGMHLQILLVPVLYFDKAQTVNYFNQIAQEIEANIAYVRSLGEGEVVRLASVMLITLAIALKNPAFEEEREWRLVHIPGLFGNAGGARPLSVEIIDDVPQQVCKILLQDNAENGIFGVDLISMLRKIMIGPSYEPQVMYNAFCQELRLAGIPLPDPILVATNIPLREKV